MDSKFYVSLEAARLLKEKGYNEECEYAYNEINMQIERIGANANCISDYCSAPTKTEAIDWLESKGIVVELSYDDKGHLDKALWEYFVYAHDKNGWVDAMVCNWKDYNYYKTRLEAEEAAIIKACELL